MSNKCEICNRQTQDLRFDVCYDCAMAESIISEGLDMYDKPIEKIQGYSIHMAKLKAILKLYLKEVTNEQ